MIHSFDFNFALKRSMARFVSFDTFNGLVIGDAMGMGGIIFSSFFFWPLVRQ